MSVMVVVSPTESTSVPPNVVQSGTPPHPPQGPHHMAKQQQAAYRSVCQATCVTIEYSLMFLEEKTADILSWV